MSMKWRSRCFNVSEQHRWKAKSSNKIFVANRGAVHFEYPQNWIIVPEGGTICIYDGKEPDDNIRLQVSVTQIGPAGFDRQLEQAAFARITDGTLGDRG